MEEVHFAPPAFAIESLSARKIPPTPGAEALRALKNKTTIAFPENFDTVERRTCILLSARISADMGKADKCSSYLFCKKK